MRTDVTFTMIKPSALEKKHIGPIFELINRNGFKFIAIKLVQLSCEKAEEFYKEHKGKAFFESLVQYMTSGPIVVAALQKENAVSDFRELIGNTDPTKAAFGTIRKMFAESMQKNGVHGSDCNESAKREISFFFSKEELLG
jgi:nucleoside-diphosphate kinase